jgi:hypothetical protein
MSRRVVAFLAAALRASCARSSMRFSGSRHAVPAVLALMLSAGVPITAAAQVQRNFPPTALRGSLAFGQTPEIVLNGRAARLAPAARIRDAANMMLLPGTVQGGKYLVHYTVDTSGLVKDVWILTPQEAANRTWPVTPAQAAAWQFDPAAQTWTKP